MLSVKEFGKELGQGFTKGFSPNLFAGDLGDVNDLVSSCFSLPDRGDKTSALVSVFRDVRFFVPVVVSDFGGTEFVFDVFAGEEVLLAFSCVDELLKVFSDARPMPFMGGDLCSLAVRLGVGRVLVDKGGECILVGRQAVVCVCEGRKWIPVWGDDVLLEQLGVVFESVVGAKAFYLRCGLRAECEVLVVFDLCGVTGDDVYRDRVLGLVSELRGLLVSYKPLLERVDSLEIIPIRA